MTVSSPLPSQISNSSEPSAVQNSPTQNSPEVDALTAEVHYLRSQLYSTKQQLEQVQELIRGIESSKFWRLCNQLLKTKNLLNQEKATIDSKITKLPYYRIANISDRLAGMNTIDEQAYAIEYAQGDYTGQGEIVELGCFMGAFSIAYAQGLQANPHVSNKKERIHAYDMFVWEDYMALTIPEHEMVTKLKDGDSFLSHYLNEVAPYKSHIKVNPGDLTQLGWGGGKIEFLLIDAMKSWELANSIIHNFFPALIPGKSLIQHQDFAHFWTTWIHLTMYRLREYFQPLYFVPDCSLIYKYIKPIPAELLNQTYSINSFSEQEIAAAFDYSLNITPSFMHPNIAAAKATVYYQSHDLEQARDEIKQAKAQGIYRKCPDFIQIEGLLELNQI